MDGVHLAPGTNISRSGTPLYIFSYERIIGDSQDTRNTGKMVRGVLSGARGPPPQPGDASWAVVGKGSDIKKYALNIPDKRQGRLDCR